MPYLINELRDTVHCGYRASEFYGSKSGDSRYALTLAMDKDVQIVLLRVRLELLESDDL